MSDLKILDVCGGDAPNREAVLHVGQYTEINGNYILDSRKGVRYY